LSENELHPITKLALFEHQFALLSAWEIDKELILPSPRPQELPIEPLPGFPWRSKMRRRWIVLCFLGAIGMGCVSNRPYRDRDSRPWANEADIGFMQTEQLDQYEPYSTEKPNHRFDLSYIEFDEKGDYWDRRQLGWTVQAIKRVAAAKDVVLVVYVHGWQNDASAIRGHDVGKFHCLLEHLSAADEGRHRFFGVYVAWRGKSVPGGDGVFPQGSPLDLIAKGLFFIPHELSFYGRKNAATRVAGLPVTEAIFQSVASTRKAARESGHQSRTILIGHSFGALLLEKALAQALAAKVISEDSGTFTAPADFVVLLNSAGESIYAKEMIDMLRRRQISRKGASGDEISAEHPLIVSITSKADWATGILFPVGTQLSNATGHFRRYNWDDKYGTGSSNNISQREYFTQTPGHNPRLLSHRAWAQKGPARSPTYQDTDVCSEEMLTAFRRNLGEPLTGPRGEIRFLTLGADGQETQWELKDQIPQGRLRTPYWIIQVPKEIIRDHSDIFNENALAMMARLFRVSNPASEPGLMTTAPRTMRLADPGQTKEGR
jgi:pimeloyl-ACP methyl ester carboxylesterase